MDVVDFGDDIRDHDFSFLYKHQHRNLDHVFVHLPYLNSNWILLDTQSTVHIFFNKALLTNITTVPTDESLTCYSNAGSQETTQRTLYEPFGSVWFNPEALANILSFAIVGNDFPVSYIQPKNIFVVTLPNDNVMPFIRSPR